MMYYIDKPATWSAANRKCAEIQEYVGQYKNCLIADELSRDALIQDIRHKVEELNAAYPRTKTLKVHFDFSDFLSCFADPRKVDDQYVFTIRFLPVRRTYQFAENVNALNEGGEK
jgi:hypothetical protein